MISKAMLLLSATAALLASSSSNAQDATDGWNHVQNQGQPMRAQGAPHDYFMVSQTGSGLAERRFYVDRSAIQRPDATGAGRAWVDDYSAEGAQRPIQLVHSKALWEVRCTGLPQMRVRTVARFAASGATTVSQPGPEWHDVIPGTSMETTYRFICDDRSTNAYYQVPSGQTADADAMSFYERTQ